MLTHIRRSAILVIVCLVLFGLAFPLLGVGLSQLFFKHQAGGSITANGSTLIGQSWSSPEYFHGRPDADDPLVANGVAGGSGASNLGPRSRVLVTDTQKLIAFWHKQGVQPTADLVTTSGSGLDPDITPADALVQIPMVARASGVSAAALRHLIAAQTHGPQLGFLGSSYIDVLQLNQALAKLEK